MNSVDSSMCSKGSLQNKLNIKVYEEKNKEEHWKHCEVTKVTHGIHT